MRDFNPDSDTLIWGRSQKYREPRIYKTMAQAKKWATPGSIYIVHLEWNKVEE